MKNIRFRWVFLLYAIILSVCVFATLPTMDDFSDGAAPCNNDGTWSRLLPNQYFWRPIEKLIGYGLGETPCLFPWLNFGIVLTGHFLLCLFLYKVLKKLTYDSKSIWLGIFFFFFSPGIIATVAQVDGISSCWALVMGATATISFFRAKFGGKYKIGYYIGYFLSAMISVLFKENGIVWFLSPIFLYITYAYANDDKKLLFLIRKELSLIGVGILGMMLYFTLRFSFMGEIALGSPSGTYSFSLNPINVMRNYCTMLVGAWTAIDPLAFFLKPRNLILFCGSICLTLPFFTLVFSAIWQLRQNRKTLVELSCLLVCVFYIASPFAIMGHVAEMSAYQMVFSGALFFGILFSNYRWRSWTSIVMIVFLVCMIFVSGHKLLVMRNFSHDVGFFLETSKEKFRNIPKRVFVYCVDDVSKEYSVYKQPVGYGAWDGFAFRSQWGWLNPEYFQVEYVESKDEIKFTPEDYPECDTVFILTRSGSLTVLRN